MAAGESYSELLSFRDFRWFSRQSRADQTSFGPSFVDEVIKITSYAT